MQDRSTHVRKLWSRLTCGTVAALTLLLVPPASAQVRGGGGGGSATNNDATKLADGVDTFVGSISLTLIAILLPIGALAGLVTGGLRRMVTVLLVGVAAIWIAGGGAFDMLSNVVKSLA